MVKVMVSFPDEVLRAIDAEADRRGTTRSALLRTFAEDALHQRSIRRAARMEEIAAAGDHARGHGGRVAEVLKANRPER
ncbi:ribbon-helix-helix domain-containing protein [Raineyella sp. W15-4]|uniref:ribbon-helix-helix domain-containing protein n=1 Tax=Raineyella sp. W15-4 TaxID=3081651 RepID=UPI00295485CC|nr:ribbon-helix-helix protein, CopG family [Raineyella sp. W15-4]WOQ17498.1 ribbon-helix-helix protein, CopG family [Raineyella sp. W15-4]